MKKALAKNKLTPKQALFIQEYLIDLNATQAAIRAGYAKKTAGVIGFENLTKPEIVQALAEAQQKRAEKIGITQQMVLDEYAKLAFLDPRKFYDKDGGLIPVPELPAEVAATLCGLEVNEIWSGSGEERQNIGVTKKIKFIDKKGALDSVAKHLGMFVDLVRFPDGIDLNVNDMSEARKTELKELAGLRASIELNKIRSGRQHGEGV